MMLAFLAAWRRLTLTLRREGQDLQHAENLVFWCAIGGIIGARVMVIFENLGEFLHDPLSFILTGAGFVFYGGFVGGLLAGLLYTKRHNLKFFQFADYAAPSLALGYAIGRIGCHLSGDGDYGIQTSSSFWGFRYEAGVFPTPPGVLVYPTPIFEALTAFAICFILVRLGERHVFKRSGQLFGVYLMLASVERFTVEFIRINPKLLFGLSEAQLFGIALFIIGCLLLTFSSLSKNQTLTP